MPLPQPPFFLLLLLTVSVLVDHMQCVIIKMKKQNIYIPLSSNYTFKLDIVQSRSLINPIQLSINHMIYNSLGTTNQYFDYFKYLSNEDIACYNYSIGNSSFLYPCPFLTNSDSVLRTYFVEETLQTQDQMIRNMNQIHQYFIIDNTPYPFPDGAYPYANLSITSTTTLDIVFNDSYKNAGVRLIFITVTLIVVYTFVISILVYRTKKIEREMLQKVPNYNYNTKRRGSELSQNNEIRQQDQESDIDNYQQILPNEMSLRYSRQSKDRGDYKFKGRQRLENQRKDQSKLKELPFQGRQSQSEPNRDTHKSNSQQK